MFDGAKAWLRPLRRSDRDLNLIRVPADLGFSGLNGLIGQGLVAEAPPRSPPSPLRRTCQPSPSTCGSWGGARGRRPPAPAATQAPTGRARLWGHQRLLNHPWAPDPPGNGPEAEVQGLQRTVEAQQAARRTPIHKVWVLIRAGWLQAPPGAAGRNGAAGHGPELWSAGDRGSESAPPAGGGGLGGAGGGFGNGDAGIHRSRPAGMWRRLSRTMAQMSFELSGWIGKGSCIRAARLRPCWLIRPAWRALRRPASSGPGGGAAQRPAIPNDSYSRLFIDGKIQSIAP